MLEKNAKRRLIVLDGFGQHADLSLDIRVFDKQPRKMCRRLIDFNSATSGFEKVECAIESPLPRREIRRTAEELAPFMRPSSVVRIDSMPRTEGAQKISRRELSGRKVLESFEMYGG